MKNKESLLPVSHRYWPNFCLFYREIVLKVIKQLNCTLKLVNFTRRVASLNLHLAYKRGRKLYTYVLTWFFCSVTLGDYHGYQPSGWKSNLIIRSFVRSLVCLQARSSVRPSVRMIIRSFVHSFDLSSKIPVRKHNPNFKPHRTEITATWLTGGRDQEECATFDLNILRYHGWL